MQKPPSFTEDGTQVHRGKGLVQGHIAWRWKNRVEHRHGWLQGPCSLSSTPKLVRVRGSLPAWVRGRSDAWLPVQANKGQGPGRTHNHNAETNRGNGNLGQEARLGSMWSPWHSSHPRGGGDEQTRTALGPSLQDRKASSSSAQERPSHQGSHMVGGCLTPRMQRWDTPGRRAWQSRL